MKTAEAQDAKITVDAVYYAVRNLHKEIHELREDIHGEFLTDEDLDFIKATRKALLEVEHDDLESYTPEEFSKKLCSEW